MKWEEQPVPGKPHCFLQLLYDLVSANLPDEHLLGMEQRGHGGNRRPEPVFESRKFSKRKIEDEEMQCRQITLKCVFSGKGGRELGPSCFTRMTAQCIDTVYMWSTVG